MAESRPGADILLRQESFDQLAQSAAATAAAAAVVAAGADGRSAASDRAHCDRRTESLRNVDSADGGAGCWLFAPLAAEAPLLLLLRDGRARWSEEDAARKTGCAEDAGGDMTATSRLWIVALTSHAGSRKRAAANIYKQNENFIITFDIRDRYSVYAKFGCKNKQKQLNNLKLTVPILRE